MGKSADLLINRLKDALAPHGAVARFCRESGLARNSVENWLAGRAAPTVANLDRIAAALGVSPVALIDDGSPAAKPHSLEDCISEVVIHARAGAKTRDLFEGISAERRQAVDRCLVASDAEISAILKGDPLSARLARLDADQRSAVLATLEAYEEDLPTGQEPGKHPKK